MMNTKNICEKIGVTPKMLRIYEEAGLVNPKRKANGYRDYSIEDVFKIEITVRLRSLGFSIKEIHKIFELESMNETEERYLNAFYIQIEAVEGKIKEFTEIKRKLRNAINKIINIDNKDSIMEIIHDMPLENNMQNAYDSLIRAWDFDNMAIDYFERYLKDDKDYKDGIEYCRSAILSEAKGSKIVDVGCGTCNLWENCDKDYNLTCLDSSLNMLIVSQKKIPWARFYLADITDMDGCLYNKYDYVISTFTLHHINRNYQNMAILNMLKLCNSEGKLVIVDKYFHNRKERLLIEKELEKNNSLDELEILKSEQPIYLEELKKTVACRNYKLELADISNRIGCFVIYKQ